MGKQFWVDAAERAAKTAAQAAAGVLAGSTLVEIDWQAAAAIVGTAVLGSLLTSLGSMSVGDRVSASLFTPVRPVLPVVVGAPTSSSTSSWPTPGRHVVRPRSSTDGWDA